MKNFCAAALGDLQVMFYPKRNYLCLIKNSFCYSVYYTTRKKLVLSLNHKYVSHIIRIGIYWSASHYAKYLISIYVRGFPMCMFPRLTCLTPELHHRWTAKIHPNLRVWRCVVITNYIKARFFIFLRQNSVHEFSISRTSWYR